jgi:EmrB/QacA subfamily drug resistance transporter
MSNSTNKRVVLTAMVFAVAMMFIDQTIVAIAAPTIAGHLSLSATGSEWVVNSYLLALAALFAFGGRLADLLGRRRAVVVGVIGFAAASALCGATPRGPGAEAWLITFRALQGASGALLFPAAVGIVVAAFPVMERGRAMAVFFGISGALTAVGPIAGGFLTQWTWRSIFWINVPVALVALVLIAYSKPVDERRPGRLDWIGAGLVTGAMGLIVLGLQQAGTWGWADGRTIGCLGVGLAMMGAFVAWERRTDSPLVQLRVFAQPAFAVDSAVLALVSVVFVPFFFFASVYAQIGLGENAASAGLYVMYFFIGFVVMSQIGGRILDRRGARPAVVYGCALGAIGFFLLAGKLTNLSLGAQWPFIVLAGAGPGLMLGAASTDATNRALSASFSEVTGITQTARNFGASVGLAVLGTILVTRDGHTITAALTRNGVPAAIARHVAGSLTSSSPGSGAHRSPALIHDVQLAFAHSSQTVFYVMAAVMAAAFLLSVRRYPRSEAALVAQGVAVGESR